jgi:hypothetical protein
MIRVSVHAVSGGIRVHGGLRIPGLSEKHYAYTMIQTRAVSVIGTAAMHHAAVEDVLASIRLFGTEVIPQLREFEPVSIATRRPPHIGERT